MLRLLALLTIVLAQSPSAPAAAATTIDYVFTSEHTTAGRDAVLGHSRTISTIAGPAFINVSQRSGAIERSEDDGLTTSFGALHAEPHTPLVREAAAPWAPIVGSVTDETLVIGESTPGPTLFGVATRIYLVDHDYAIASRVAYVFRNKVFSHARYTFTVADIGVSSAALRVALSRGYGHALCSHPEAFSGLPLAIEGVIESPSSVTHVHVQAQSLQR